LSAVSAALAPQPQSETIALFQRGRAGHKILKKKCASHGSKIEAFFDQMRQKAKKASIFEPCDAHFFFRIL
jgi:hypothetical protein